MDRPDNCATFTGASLGASLGAVGGPVGASVGANIGARIGAVVDESLGERERMQWENATEIPVSDA